MQRVTGENWDQIAQSVRALVEFSTSWCGPCRIQKQILDSIANEGATVFMGEVNIEEDFELADKFKVQSVPTLVLFDHGREQQRFVGLQQKSTLDALLRK